MFVESTIVEAPILRYILLSSWAWFERCRLRLVLVAAGAANSILEKKLLCAAVVERVARVVMSDGARAVFAVFCSLCALFETGLVLSLIVWIFSDWLYQCVCCFCLNLMQSQWYCQRRCIPQGYHVWSCNNETRKSPTALKMGAEIKEINLNTLVTLLKRTAMNEWQRNFAKTSDIYRRGTLR
jgi:hypothetical protein